MADQPKKRGLIFFALALILGVGVGVVTVYVNGGFDGNASGETKLAEAQAACQMSEAQRAALDAAAVGDLAAMRIADKPVPLTDIGFQMPDGSAKQFTDLNKVLVLNLWATWCGPCREEMPDLANIQKEYGNDDFEVFALNVDRNGGEKPQKFLESIKATSLNLYLDPANKSFQNFRSKGLVFGLPTTMIVDPKGCVQGVLAGIAHWGSDDAKNLVEVSIKTLGGKT
ncbi:MAG: TlpA disulfide reductase family protein [Hyphomicrobiales bacterium]